MLPGDVVVRTLDSRLKRSQIQVAAVLLSGNNLGQVVHIVTEQCKLVLRSSGDDALQLGR